MNLLLDTHTFLWFADRNQSAHLPGATTSLLEDANNAVFLSLASVWEIAIKVSIGKLQLKAPVTKVVAALISSNTIEVLPITLAHLDLIETLPFHHKDPFDRLLIAQAQVEQLPIVSVDPALDDYGVNRVWLT